MAPEGPAARTTVVILGATFGFPHGMGATARVHSYAKGLQAEGVVVHVVCLQPTEPPGTVPLNTRTEGTYEGITFTYPGGLTGVATTRCGRILSVLPSLVGTFLNVVRLHRESRISAFLLFGADSPIYLIFTWCLARSLGAAFVAERNEFPFVYVRRTCRVRVTMWLNEHLFNRLFDGAIVISSFLAEYLQPRLHRRARLLQVPILVDAAAFNDVPIREPANGRVIAYCGNLDHAGEAANVVHLFAAVASGFPGCRLRIIGGASRADVELQLRSLVESLNLGHRVDFRGAVPRHLIPLELSSADVMILPRAAGTFSEAGFPTKLAEYLATGRPVVVTSTGDISHYLQDGVNAFLVPPDAPEAFVDRLRWVLSNPLEASRVGARGRLLALTVFDYRANCRRIKDFLEALKSPQASRESSK